MGKQKQSVWAAQVQYEEIYGDLENKEESTNLLNDAYEALNRFYQKEQRRIKTPKKSKNCWQ